MGMALWPHGMQHLLLELAQQVRGSQLGRQC